jgi:PEP-CTERM motif
LPNNEKPAAVIPESTPEAPGSVGGSHAVRLLRAAALAAILLPLGTVALEATPITCGFGSNPGCGAPGPGGSDNVFNFGAYSLSLAFATVSGSFDVTVNDVPTTQGALTATGRFDRLPGYQCVPIDGSHCVDFAISAPGPGSSTWAGFYTLFIVWALDTNAAFPNAPGNRIRILHNRGNVPGDGFDTDITVLGSYLGASGISGTDDNFQSFIVAQTVPEPASIVLVTMGIGGLLYGSRRREQKNRLRAL